MSFGIYVTKSTSSGNVGAQQTIISRTDLVIEVGHIPGSFKFIDVKNIDEINVFGSLSHKLKSAVLVEAILVSSVSKMSTCY